MFAVSVACMLSASAVKWNRVIWSPRNNTTTAQNNKTHPLCCLEFWEYQKEHLKIQFVTLRFFFLLLVSCSVCLCLMTAPLVTDDLCLSEPFSNLFSVPVWHTDWGHAWEPWLHHALALLSCLCLLPPVLLLDSFTFSSLPSRVLFVLLPYPSVCVCSANIFQLWLAIVFFPQPVSCLEPPVSLESSLISSDTHCCLCAPQSYSPVSPSVHQGKQRLPHTRTRTPLPGVLIDQHTSSPRTASMLAR